MDQIYVMHHGKLVEQGTHRSLLARRGLYFELWQKQSGFEVSNDGRFAQIDADRLKQVHLFEAIEPDRLAQFANRFHSEFFEAGQDVIVEGEMGDKLYVIARGTVHVLVKDQAGKEQFIDCMEDGDYFGEMALLLNQPRSATIRTVTPTLLLSLSREQFFHLLDQFPEHRPAIDRRIALSQANQAAIRNRVLSSI
jgi:ATP-binding cassette subfamily B protein